MPRPSRADRAPVADAAPAASHSLSLSVQYDARAGTCPADRSQIRRWVIASLQRDADFTVRLVGRTEARSLNRTYRGRDYATNVLTFEYGSFAGLQAPVQADIIVCMPVVVSEARAQRKRLRDHLAHLVVHGCLHAQGLDHENELDAQHMEALETLILKRFRIDDPYR